MSDHISPTQPVIPGSRAYSIATLASSEAPVEVVEAWHRVQSYSHEYLWRVEFRLLEEMPHSPRPIALSRQIVLGHGYYSDGLLRAAHDHCYFCYSLSGAGTFWDGRGAYSVPAGWGFLMEINDPKTGYHAELNAETPWQFLAFEFTGLAARALVRDVVSLYGAFFKIAEQAPIVRRLQSFETEGYKVTHAHALDGAEIVIELLLALAASARFQQEPGADHDLVKRALQLIEEHTESAFGVSELAQRLGVSRERLSRLFRLRLNLSPHQLIQEQRIRHASFLLKDTDMPIKQIAARLGYTDYTNFIRAFRQVMHMTPHEFRLHGSIQFQMSPYSDSAPDTSR